MPTIPQFIFAQLKPFRWQLTVLLIFCLLWAIDLSLAPYIIKMIIDRMSTTPFEAVWSEVGRLLGAYIALSVFMVIIFRVWNIIRRSFIPFLKGNITRSMTSHLLEHSYQYYQNNFAGSLANKVNDVAYGTAQIVEIFMEQFVANFLMIVVATGVMLTVQPMVALLFLIWVIIFLVGSRYFARRAHQLADKSSELRSQLTGKVVDVLSNTSIVRLFARQKLERGNIAEWTHETVAAERAFDWHLLKLFFFQSVSFIVMQAIILLYLIYERSLNKISVGDFALVFMINGYIVDNLWNLAREFLNFAEQLGKVSQGLRVTLQTHDIVDAPDAKPLHVSKGVIRFDKVKFHYHHATPLFENLSVTINAGQKVGLVGYSGSGKTTFVNLILRLFEINSGAIYLDDQNIAQLTQVSLRETISLIPQDPTLFHRTLAENISYGEPSATKEQIVAAAVAAQADDFIRNLPQGYDTLVGERGIKLSGGQRQRIAISRAILKNAPILILDEATSSLDSVTEQAIQTNFLQLMSHKTTLVVAHRLSTLLHMDRILVFDAGEIVEDGTHSELLQQNGLYANLWHSQVAGFLPEQRH